MLSIQDLNQIIKDYGYKLQQRIEELNSSHNSYLSQMDNDDLDSGLPHSYNLISKYQNYSTSNPREIKYINKLSERVLQIYRFFKEKSSNQNLLGNIQVTIEQELSALINKEPIHVGQVFAYIRLITKKGCIIKVPAERRRILSRSILKENKENKVQDRLIPTPSSKMLQRRTVSLTTKTINRSNILGEKAGQRIDKQRISQTLDINLKGLQFQKPSLLRLIDSAYAQQNLQKDMLRRNDKVIQELRRYDRQYRRYHTHSQDEKKQTILVQMKNCSGARGMTGNRKKRLGYMRKKNNLSIKQNLTLFA